MDNTHKFDNFWKWKVFNTSTSASYFLGFQLETKRQPLQFVMCPLEAGSENTRSHLHTINKLFSQQKKKKKIIQPGYLISLAAYKQQFKRYYDDKFI